MAKIDTSKVITKFSRSYSPVPYFTLTYLYLFIFQITDMHIKSSDNQFFRAGDHTMLKEVLHPKNNPVNVPFSLAYAYLEPGQSSLMHKLAESETYYIISGSGIVHNNEEKHQTEKGDCVYVAVGAPQFIENTGSSRLEFLCIVSPAWSEAGEQILE